MKPSGYCLVVDQCLIDLSTTVLFGQQVPCCCTDQVPAQPNSQVHHCNQAVCDLSKPSGRKPRQPNLTIKHPVARNSRTDCSMHQHGMKEQYRLRCCPLLLPLLLFVCIGICLLRPTDSVVRKVVLDSGGGNGHGSLGSLGAWLSVCGFWQQQTSASNRMARNVAPLRTGTLKDIKNSTQKLYTQALMLFCAESSTGRSWDINEPELNVVCCNIVARYLETRVNTCFCTCLPRYYALQSCQALFQR
jgi:hypothetical protein